MKLKLFKSDGTEAGDHEVANFLYSRRVRALMHYAKSYLLSVPIKDKVTLRQNSALK